jgi:hypothetical protein
VGKLQRSEFGVARDIILLVMVSVLVGLPRRLSLAEERASRAARVISGGGVDLAGVSAELKLES